MKYTSREQRWRLILGRFAQGPLGNPRGEGARLERTLAFLYDREYEGRAIPRTDKGSGGSLDPSRLTLPRWSGEIRDLFPKETISVLESEAICRYGLEDLLSQPQTLENLQPDMDLATALLSLKGRIDERLHGQIRRMIAWVTRDIEEKLAKRIRTALQGRIDRYRRGPKVYRNLDWKRTIRANLRHYDGTRLIPARLHFSARVRRHIPWDIILCVDQSASMAASVVHSAVLASVLHGLSQIHVRLVLFDTQIVDMTDQVDDPVSLLMSVQMGGGTHIARALQYCESLVHQPRRTVLVLISDFEEGGSVRNLVRSCLRLREAGVTLIGLASLDQSSEPYYDRGVAAELSAAGMDIAALTPGNLAEWLAGIMQ